MPDDPEFHRPVPALRDPRVHAVRVRLEEAVSLGAGDLELRGGDPPELERAQRSVRADGARAEQLAQPPERGVPQQVHLPHPVAGVQVTDRGEKIFLVAGRDVRHAERIPQHYHGIPQAGDRFPSAERRYLGAQPEPRRAAGRAQQGDEAKCAPEQPFHVTSMIWSRRVPTLT